MSSAENSWSIELDLLVSLLTQWKTLPEVNILINDLPPTIDKLLLNP